MLSRLSPRNWLGLALVWLVSTPAGASPIPNAVYTLDASVPFSIIGAAGTVDAYLPAIDGPLLFGSNAICLDGGCGDPNDYSNYDWMVIRVTVTSGSLDEVGVGSLFESSSGVGYFGNLGGAAPTGGDSTTNPNTPQFTFASLAGDSAPLFVLYDPNSLPSGGGPFGPGATNLVVRLGGASDQEQGFVTTPIPEPSTALLVGMGLLGCGFARRRFRG